MSEKKTSKTLAEEHWSYVSRVLAHTQTDPETISVIGFHYKTAFEHGYKHAIENREQPAKRHSSVKDLKLCGVVQRFRWIPPGRFMMGSPEDEPGRYIDETLHEVILTKGYWLADTACTQELWQAVMGNNPSHFKGSSRLPVENVSWDNCQKFLKKINSMVSDLKLCLPTEAQWEYACRAGTTTPFSFGRDITPEQVNYDGDNPYVPGKKGEYREKTVEVKSLPVNPWGLYEIHGNVWEWCSDWYGEYPIGGVVDPTGPNRGSNRVIRGGSWSSNARYCRSAFRNDRQPGYRIVSLGFRLMATER